VNTDHRRTELKFSRDERLLAGVRGAVEHVANRHSLAADDRIDLAEASEQACRRAFLQLDGAGDFCTVVIDDFVDRVEVSVESPRSSSSAKPDIAVGTSFASPGDDPEAAMKTRVDRVDHDTNNGRARIILTKYFHKNPAHL